MLIVLHCPIQNVLLLLFLIVERQCADTKQTTCGRVSLQYLPFFRVDHDAIIYGIKCRRELLGLDTNITALI